MTATAHDLAGAWRLESWTLQDDGGGPLEYPLGPAAQGLIMYTADGHVSATLMRGGRSAVAPVSDPEKAAAYADSFAYAGRYEVRDGTVFHTIQVATNPALVGITSTRHIALEGDRLTLSGPDFSAASARTQRIVWQRAGR
ncbi:MAG: lipocalin-like domain-containing protein [Hyphomicrobiaceae bacterium]